MESDNARLISREADHTQFFEAMEIEISDHEARRHWDLMLRTDLPIGAKTIMAIWSSTSLNSLSNSYHSMTQQATLLGLQSSLWSGL